MERLQLEVATVDDDLSSDDSDAKKRREILARRPSYRKILNDLSSPVNKMEDDSNSSQSQDGQEYVQSGTLQLTAHGDATPATQGLQTLTMTNASPTSASNSTGGTTIVQYAQGPDGQFYIPVGGTNVQAYQIPGSLAQGVVMTGVTGSPISSPQHMSEEGSRKRELRLLKNREAARECRRKKKEYVKCLENRVAVLENQNKTLIEELKALKELYCQKDA
ncbi:cyclic AMP-responsive element-binding protein 1-like isoform X4 [Biomphalaria glabrata]|uniref:Cyclic AMP-responsive element-binding protein 1-like isoform X4 n=1 Tax=Biomphalaria glabrata TaxID=6526 RepID=A0A9W2YLA4_BIOGL|nr:cyclic AMP-responsive element-binding protein 1-like isoform X4 [Biomphalaria glabrata]